MNEKFIGKWAFPLNDSPAEQVGRRGAKHDFRRIAADIAGKLALRTDDVLLEVCCGNCAVTKHLVPLCKEIHAVDFDPALLAAAGKMKEEENISTLHLYRADASDIKKLFSGKRFDKILCYFSFQYFNRSRGRALIQTLAELSLPGGLILLGDIPDKNKRKVYYSSMMLFYKEKFARFITGKEGESGLGWWWNPDEIVSRCNSLGLNAQVLSQSPDLPHAHYRVDILINVNK